MEDEIFDWVEESVREEIKRFESMETFTDVEEYRRQGAIGALEHLLEIWNQE